MSYLNLSHLILSHLISSYLISSYLISSYLISSYLILPYLILSYLILSFQRCVGAAAWRIVLLPLDAAKTSLQVNGEKGLQVLKEKVENEGIQGLFAGALAGSAATFVGHYPWFLTYNYLSDKLPTANDVIASIHIMTSDIAVTAAKGLELQGTDLDILITAPVLAHFPVDLTLFSSVISHLLTVRLKIFYR